MAVNTTVARIWRGWTTVEDADAYQAIVDSEVLPAIFERHIPGLVSAHLMRADAIVDGEVEFTTIIWFESLDSVKNFIGEDYQRSHVPENAQAVLKRFDSEAKHSHILNYFA
jgi:heme-degrading monooxygenase HmoA